MEKNEDAEQQPLLPPNAQEPPPVAAPAPQPLSRPPSLRERKLKNLHKRVKLHSKRLREHWAAIAAFLDLPSTVAFAITCRRLQHVLRDDQVWCAAQLLERKEPATEPIARRSRRDRRSACEREAKSAATGTML